MSYHIIVAKTCSTTNKRPLLSPEVIYSVYFNTGRNLSMVAVHLTVRGLSILHISVLTKAPWEKRGGMFKMGSR